MHGRNLILPILLAVAALTAPAASAGELTTTCRSATDYAAGACRLAEVAASNVSAACRREVDPLTEEQCATPLNPTVADSRIGAYERSWTSRTLDFQYELSAPLGFRDAPWVGTHNSSNTAAESFTVSGGDHNQQVSMADQLRMDVRSLELDLHWIARPAGEPAVLVCHGRGAGEMHAGCTNERRLDERLPEIRAWLDRPENADQVIMLYLEDHLEGVPGHDSAAAALVAGLGNRIYRPAPGATCARPLPSTGLSREAIRKAGKQVLLVAKGCGAGTAWAGLVFDFGGMEVESRPQDYNPDCSSDFTPEQHRTKMVRYFEDSTLIAHATHPTGVSSMDDGLTPATTAAMVRCGVELFGFDQLLPDDGRLDALAWSWARDEPRRAGCAVRDGATGRWAAFTCGSHRTVACRTPAGRWILPAKKASFDDATALCSAAGATFDPPRTGTENAALGALTGKQDVWVAVRSAESAKGKATARSFRATRTRRS